MRAALAADDLVRSVELDIAFHTAIVDASRNRYLQRTWHLVGMPSLVWSPERDGYATPRPRWTASLLAKHEDLVRAMRTRDVDVCVRAVREHIASKIADIPAAQR
jgi:DNA-binding GntR family transcriptional regulator